jgi:hypothetical protein
MASEARLIVKAQPFSLLEPDLTAALQYADHASRKLASVPEKMLMWAVLEDAILCLQEDNPAGGTVGTRRFHEARYWIMEKDSDWFFSFESICAALDLHAGYIRNGLFKRERTLSSRPMEADHSQAPAAKKPAKKRKYQAAA